LKAGVNWRLLVFELQYKVQHPLPPTSAPRTFKVIHPTSTKETTRVLHVAEFHTNGRGVFWFDIYARHMRIEKYGLLV
jgi:hypothetical protein